MHSKELQDKVLIQIAAGKGVPILVTNFCETKITLLAIENVVSKKTLSLAFQILDGPYDIIIGRHSIIEHELWNFILDAPQVSLKQKTNMLSGLLVDKIDALQIEEGNDYIDEMWEPYDVINHNAPSYGIESIHYGEDCPPELRAELEALCKEFEDIFSTVIREEPAHVTPMELNVDESKWYLPKNRLPPRAHSVKKREEVITQVNFMLKWKVIRPSQAQAWSHAHLTPKPFDLWRFCVDLRNLNEACESMNWSIG